MGSIVKTFGVAADATTTGLVTTGSQTFAGTKTFSSNIVVPSTQYIPYIAFSGTFNDSSVHTFGAIMQNFTTLIKIIDGGGECDIPCYPNGGGGVAYKWTVLDPDTGWLINQAGVSFSFTIGGTLGGTYTLALGGGSGSLDITRTAGSTAYTIYGIRY